ncbi:MAG: fimbrillin family protein [Paludibacteraceae bacterium]|nr:fimbrillin family protein [Paludibacteraceae bacterium]
MKILLLIFDIKLIIVIFLNLVIMKKLFFGIALLALLAGCSQNETISQPKSDYISFSSAFIDKATRADNSITTANLDLFEVYGHYNPLSAVFDKVEVKKQIDGTWFYGTAKTWEEGETYFFHAIAPAKTISLSPYPSQTTTKGIPVFSYTNDGSKDLIYAFASREQPLKIDAPINTSPVDFTFDHLLSRVKFTFENQITTGKDIEVLDVAILEVSSQGTIDLNEPKDDWEWTLNSAMRGYECGKTGSIAPSSKKAAEEILFLLPAPAKTYKVQFVIRYEGVDHLQVAEVKDVEFKMGYSYNFTAKVTDSHVSPLAENIEFDVTGVNNWPMDNANDVVF